MAGIQAGEAMDDQLVSQLDEALVPAADVTLPNDDGAAPPAPSVGKITP